MSEQINPIVSEKDMGADGKLRKWSTGRKAKWIIWIVVILAAALGFWHQHYMRSDSQIKAVFDDNKANFQTTAEFMIESISCEKPTLPKGKCSIKSLTENNACKSVKKELEELERRNVTYIDSDGLTVKFYTIYDHYYIYRSPISSSGGEDNLGNGWSIILDGSSILSSTALTFACTMSPNLERIPIVSSFSVRKNYFSSIFLCNQTVFTFVL